QLAQARRDRGQAVGLERHEYRVSAGHRGHVVGHWRLRDEITARRQHTDTVVAHCREVRAPRDQRDVGSAAGQRGTDVGPDGSGAQHGEPHGWAGPPGLARAGAPPAPPGVVLEPPGVATSSPTRRRWILPVAVRGIWSRIWIVAGTLNAASRSRQCPISCAASAWADSVTAADTSSPYLSSATPKQTASLTAGCVRRACSTSAGEIFSPPRRIISLSRPSRYR